jgi:hypothetical protein
MGMGMRMRMPHIENIVSLISKDMGRTLASARAGVKEF